MPATSRATRVAWTTIAISVVLLVVVAYVGFSINHASVRMERMLIERVLNRVISDVLVEQQGINSWKEALGRAQAGDASWLDKAIGRRLGHDLIYILDQNDIPLYTYRRRNETIAAPVISAALLPMLDEVRGRASGLSTKGAPLSLHVRDVRFLAPFEGQGSHRWAAHLLSIAGRPAIISMITLGAASPGRAPVAVSVVFVDQQMLARIGRRAMVDQLRLAEPDSRGVFDNAHARLSSDDGTTIGILRWRQSHTGHDVLFIVLPLVLVVVLWVVGASIQMLRRPGQAQEELAESHRIAEERASTDALTGLPNRPSFARIVDDRLRQWLKEGGVRPLIAYLDLDRFKDVNDTLGHEAGDVLLCAATARLVEFLPQSVIIARLGGDEFALICDAAEPLAGWNLGRTICAAFSSPIQVGEQEIAISVSVGIAVPDEAGEVSATLLGRQADIALNRAKDEGRQRAINFRPEMAAEVERRRQLEIDLRTALSSPKGTSQLRLVYQPVLTIEGHPRFESVEALLRWDHPQHGLIAPDIFIPLAESSGQMPALGEWVLAQSLKDSARWPGLKVAVNLSPVQLKAEGFVRRASRLALNANVQPSRIILEVTESVMMDASGQAGQSLRDLRELGFKVALDDFGTGYSSLSYLRRYKFDRLKMDRLFTEGVGEDEEAMAVIEMVVALGRRLGLEIVAEGIENGLQARLMKQAGCTHLQGWFIARPLEVAEIDAIDQTGPSIEPIVQALRGAATSS